MSWGFKPTLAAGSTPPALVQPSFPLGHTNTATGALGTSTPSGALTTSPSSGALRTAHSSS